METVSIHALTRLTERLIRPFLCIRPPALPEGHRGGGGGRIILLLSPIGPPRQGRSFLCSYFAPLAVLIQAVVEEIVFSEGAKELAR